MTARQKWVMGAFSFFDSHLSIRTESRQLGSVSLLVLLYIVFRLDFVLVFLIEQLLCISIIYTFYHGKMWNIMQTKTSSMTIAKCHVVDIASTRQGIMASSIFLAVAHASVPIINFFGSIQLSKSF